jgi:ceramide glucosyltransferase
MTLLHPLTAAIGLLGLGLSTTYALLTAAAVIVWRVRKGSRVQKRANPSHSTPAVTLFKPLCGAEPGLYQDLRSFCLQDYPQVQIVFGVREAADPALSVVKRLAEEFPSLQIEIVVNPKLHGSNGKISNLINMLPHAHHDILVMADSDALVGSDYLRTVTSPLRDSNVGAVTCLYTGFPTPSIWSRLGAMYINDWYMPAVLLAWLFGHQSYLSGQTVCLRRDTLRAIGGLRSLANHLADDYMLGERIRALGLRIVLSHYVVRGEYHEPSFNSVIDHELRWMRTIRILRPLSFRFLFVSFSWPLSLLGIILAGIDSPISGAAWALFATTATARVLLHFIRRTPGDRLPFLDVWLIPLRDILLAWVWCKCFFTSRVIWRGNEFDVDAEGVMRRRP